MDGSYEKQPEKDSILWIRLRKLATAIGGLIRPERRHTVLLSDLYPENDLRFRGGRYVVKTVSGPTMHPEDWGAVPMLRPGGKIDEFFAQGHEAPAGGAPID